MCDSFGAGLRQRREEQQIALSTIAEQTKIKLSLLEGLERDDVSRWPSGIFRRAFVRDYARAIGLQPDAVVREFLDRYPDPPEDVTAALSAQAAADAAPASAGPPTRLRYLVGAAVGSLSRLRPGNGHGRLAEADDAPSISSTPLLLNTLNRVATVDTSETVEIEHPARPLEMMETSETVEMMIDTSETVEMMYTSDTVEMPMPVRTRPVGDRTAVQPAVPGRRSGRDGAAAPGSCRGDRRRGSDGVGVGLAVSGLDGHTPARLPRRDSRPAAEPVPRGAQCHSRGLPYGSDLHRQRR